MRYLVDFEMPDRNSGGQLQVNAADEAEAIEMATRQWAREFPVVIAYNIVKVVAK